MPFDSIFCHLFPLIFFPYFSLSSFSLSRSILFSSLSLLLSLRFDSLISINVVRMTSGTFSFFVRFHRAFFSGGGVSEKLVDGTGSESDTVAVTSSFRYINPTPTNTSGSKESSTAAIRFISSSNSMLIRVFPLFLLRSDAFFRRFEIVLNL